MNSIGELVNRQIRSLAWTVYGKKAQADRSDLIEVRVVRAKMLTSELRARVWAQGLSQDLVFPEANAARRSVN